MTFTHRPGPRRRLVRGATAVSTTFPPPEPGRHGITELLALVGEVRRLAFGTLPPIEALGRIRDAFHAYDDDV
jgi:hypothetical protein